MDSKIVKAAIDMAASAETDTRCRHAAIIFDDSNKIISKARNILETTTDAAYFFHEFGHFHAESHALYKAFGHNKRRGDDKVYMISVRLNRRGDFRLALPCHDCSEAIKRARITRVYYTTDDGEILSYYPDRTLIKFKRKDY